MPGAAPGKSKGGRFAAAAATAVAALVVGAPPAAAQPSLGTSSSASAPRWAVKLDGRLRPAPTLALLKRLREAQVSIVVTDWRTWSPRPHRRLASLAQRASVRIVRPRPVPRTRAQQKSLAKACKQRRRTVVTTCAVQIRNARQARRWLGVDYIVLEVASPKAVKTLPAGTYRSKLVVVSTRPTEAALVTAVDTVLSRGEPGFGVALGAKKWQRELDAYLLLLGQRTAQQLSKGGSGRPADRKAPSKPSRLAQTASSTGSATLAWRVASDNLGVAGYGLYFGSVLIGSTTNLSYTFPGLSCGTTYTLAVDAFDAAGNRSAKASLPVSTAACGAGGGGGSGSAPDTTPPSAPMGLAATTRTQSSITLGWSPASDNVGIAAYRVHRNGAVVGSTAALSHTVEGLTCGTSYLLGVDAYDAAGNISSRSSLTATTAACSGGDTQPPSVPQSQQITGATQSTVTMAWNAATDNVAVAGYRVYLNNGLVTTTSALTYTYVGLQCGTTYTVALEAYDAAGNASSRALAQGPATTAACSGDSQPPTTPSALSATGSTSSSISLAWAASQDNVGVAGYAVYNGSSQVGSTASTSHTVSGLACGTAYTLGVEAYDAAGNRSSRSTVSASTTACSAPPPPGGSGANLWVSAAGGSCVRSSALVGFDASRACASFAAAYAAASSGDMVGVVGTLGEQSFAGGYGASQPEGSKVITFRGEPGNVVQQVHSGSPNITYDGLNLDAGGVRTFGAVFENGGADNVTFRNGRIGNVVDEKAALVDGNNFTFDNVVFHDAVIRTDGVHMECVYAIVVPNFTVRNSTFTNCAVMDLFFTYGNWWSPLPPPYGNVTLEGNRFESSRDMNGSCCHYYGLFIGNTASPGPGALDGWRVRNNWFENSVAGDDGRPITNSVFCGNTGSPPTSWRASC